MFVSLKKLLSRTTDPTAEIYRHLPEGVRPHKINLTHGDITMERDNLMHGARSALNTNMDIRAWAEEYLKAKTKAEMSDLSDEEFEKHWKYHKPEIMHAGATEAMAAYKNRDKG
jgi:hypothetical protein